MREDRPPYLRCLAPTLTTTRSCGRPEVVKRMPRFFCDYCDAYLTHDSAPGRQQHIRGWKHRDNFKAHYEKFYPAFVANATAKMQAAQMQAQIQAQANAFAFPAPSLTGAFPRPPAMGGFPPPPPPPNFPQPPPNFLPPPDFAPPALQSAPEADASTVDATKGAVKSDE